MLRIYPKKGKPFDLDFDHFRNEGDELTLHRTPNAEASGYLSIKDIAAIMPSSSPHFSDHRDLRVFTVYLGRHLDNPLHITANTYKKDSSLVTFQYRQHDLKNIYVAVEDVVGITFVNVES
jgi:hypothetical protein